MKPTLNRIAVVSFHGCPVARLGERDTGGMNVYVLQTARELGRQGYFVDVYTRYHDPKDSQIMELERNVRVIHLKAGPYGEPKENLATHIPEFLSRLYAFQKMNDLHYDIVHTHYWLSGVVGLALSQQWQVPHVTCFHTLAKIKQRARVGEAAPYARVLGEKDVIDAADAVVALSRYEKDDMVHMYGAIADKINVIPAGVDLKVFKPVNRDFARSQLGLANEKVVLYVGRVEPLKGIDILVNAVSKLDDRANVRLLVIGGNPQGDGEVLRLKKMSQELELGEQVSFLGTIPQDKLPLYYSAADVCVLPSYYESFGLVALEAMACGTPVIASRVGGLQTIIRNGKTGYLIPWRCPDPFADRLEMLLANDTLRRAIGEAARIEAQTMTWGLVAERLLDLYLSMTQSSRVPLEAGQLVSQ